MMKSAIVARKMIGDLILGNLILEQQECNTDQTGAIFQEKLIPQEEKKQERESRQAKG